MEERPLECTLCKRKAHILYKELKNGHIESCKMCSECPALQEKLGVPVHEDIKSPTDLALNQTCPNCKTHLQEVTVEGILGCAKCYETFEPFIMKQLTETNGTPIHLGTSPDLFKHENVTKKLESLQSALTEALTFENYEQAATLRDQIKILTENLYGKERKAS